MADVRFFIDVMEGTEGEKTARECIGIATLDPDGQKQEAVRVATDADRETYPDEYAAFREELKGSEGGEGGAMAAPPPVTGPVPEMPPPADPTSMRDADETAAGMVVPGAPPPPAPPRPETTEAPPPPRRHGRHSEE